MSFNLLCFHIFLLISLVTNFVRDMELLVPVTIAVTSLLPKWPCGENGSASDSRSEF